MDTIDREPQESSEDREEGTPQARLLGDEPGPEGNPAEEGAADSGDDAAREGA